MGRIVVALAFAFPFALISTAHAFVDPPTLDPAHPLSGQTVSVDIYVGGCDMFMIDPPAITRSGNTIRMVLQSISTPFSDFCIYPTGTYVFPVGTFPAGAYSLQIDRVYMDFNGLPVTQILGVLAFTATAPVSGVPALGCSGTFLFAGLLLVLAVMPLRRRMRVRTDPVTINQSEVTLIGTLLLFSLATLSQPVQAFVDPPVLATPNPVGYQPVSINITAGGCDLLIADPAPTVTVAGNNIHLVVQSATSLDLEFCTYPVFTANIVLGTFWPGHISTTS
jgi:hypothetical protein